jgi:hypothetical protein
MNEAKLKKRYLSLKGERQSSDLESAWNDIERYVRPFSGSFFQDYNTEGENRWRRSEIYNSTAVIAADSLAASIQGLLINPADKWFESLYRNEKLNRDDAAKEYLERSDGAVYQALTQSNFDIKAAEFFLDLVTYGTGIVTEETLDEVVWKGLDFGTSPVRDSFYEVNVYGELIYFFRRYMWSPLQIMERFGEDNVPDVVKQKAESGTVHEKLECFLAIYPRKDKSPILGADKVIPTERPIGYKYILLSSGEMLGEEGGYYEMPVFLAHWKSTSTSKWGKSPAMDVLADILNVNEWQQIQREAGAKSVDPSLLVQDRGLLSDLDLSPGGMTVVRKIEDVAPLETKSQINVSMEEIRGMEENINQAFMQDRLALKESPAMTATEVNMRREYMMRSITQPLAILQRNFLDKLIRNTYALMYRQGQLDEVPQIVKDEQAETDIHYNGPLPRTQKAQTVQSEMHFLTFINELKETDPEAADILDKDNMLRNIALNLGVPALDLRSEEEIDQIRKSRAAAVQKEMQLAKLQEAGEAMKSFAEGTEATSRAPELAGVINGGR